MTPLHHHIVQAKLADLIPTQGAIGYVEVDHHHLGMALHKEGQKTAQLTVLKDLSRLGRKIVKPVLIEA